jgi:hypothetical protein
MIRRTAVKFPLRSARLTSVAIIILVATSACGSNADSELDDSAGAQVADTGGVNDKYVPQVDEGLGASIAIVIDNSGSMKEAAEGDSRPKYIVAREALQAMLASTDSFVARQPDFPINVGLYRFSTRVTPMVPMARYNRSALLAALDSMPEPDGGTAIGTAMDVAREDLYRGGTFRKYILVVTDGENTQGVSPRRIAREINRRSEGAVRMYFVAFDIDAERFGFVRDVRGEVVGARNGDALRARLDEIYRGKILSEAVDAGETRPPAVDSAARDSAKPPTTPRKDTRP